MAATTYREIANDDFESAGCVGGFCRFLFVLLLFSASDLYVGILYYVDTFYALAGKLYRERIGLVKCDFTSCY